MEVLRTCCTEILLWLSLETAFMHCQGSSGVQCEMTDVETGEQAWVKEMADFVKSVDPHHLVMVGTWGYFGMSSPDLLPENPYDLSWRTSNLSNDAGIWSAGELLTRRHALIRI